MWPPWRSIDGINMIHVDDGFRLKAEATRLDVPHDWL
jgi:hypothetical protein